MMEIERKWRLSEIPSDVIFEKTSTIQQGYIVTKNGELRIRKVDKAAVITIKGEGALVRNEWEQPLPDWAFDILKNQTIGRVIDKQRHTLVLNNRVCELDEYQGDFAGLVILECEFPNMSDAKRYELPKDWMTVSREVTHDKRYKNKSIALKGIPNECED
jgi:adenylate cyclase